MAETDSSPADGGEPVPPLRPLEPRRETLVVSLSEPQWAAFHDALASTVHSRFTSASTYLHQICECSRALYNILLDNMEIRLASVH